MNCHKTSPTVHLFVVLDDRVFGGAQAGLHVAGRLFSHAASHLIRRISPWYASGYTWPGADNASHGAVQGLAEAIHFDSCFLAHSHKLSSRVAEELPAFFPPLNRRDGHT